MDPQQPGQPPAGAPGSWPPPPSQPGYPPQAPGAPAGWNPQPQPGWGQPNYVAPYAPPTQGGYPAPPFGQPAGYPVAGFGGPNYAGFWIRFVALIIDSFIYGFALVAAAISIIFIIGIVLLPLVLFGYFPFFWWKRGATPGMQVLGLRVVRAIDGGPIDGGMAGIRALVFYAESFFSGWFIGLVGFAWAAFEPRKRAWHDMAAGTVVIHTN